MISLTEKETDEEVNISGQLNDLNINLIPTLQSESSFGKKHFVEFGTTEILMF